jgi:hypothetical protein
VAICHHRMIASPDRYPISPGYMSSECETPTLADVSFALPMRFFFLVCCAQATVQMGLRDAVTGEPTIKDTSMPKFGVTAWGQATVTVSDSKILNMSYNGVCASGNSSITMQVVCPSSFSFHALSKPLSCTFCASSWQLMCASHSSMHSSSIKGRALG